MLSCYRVLLFWGSTVYFQIWKVWLYQMKNSYKIGGKSYKKIGMMLGGTAFRVQFTYPDMKRRACLNEKLWWNMGKFWRKSRWWSVLLDGVFRAKGICPKSKIWLVLKIFIFVLSCLITEHGPSSIKTNYQHSYILDIYFWLSGH